MDYPSTTQALFALIVMIIVLIFIFVYCCSGTYSCDNEASTPPDTPQQNGDTETIQRSARAHASGSSDDSGDTNLRTVFIVPINGAIHVADPSCDRIFEIPVRDKPPAYNDVFKPPPSYSVRSLTSYPSSDCVQPPSYEDSVHDWRITLDNDIRFQNYFREVSQSAIEPAISRAINALVSEATLSLTSSGGIPPSYESNSNTANACTQIQASAAERLHSVDEHGQYFSNVFSESRSNGEVSPRTSQSTQSQSSEPQEQPASSSSQRNRLPEGDVYNLMRDVEIAETIRRNQSCDAHCSREEAN